MKKIPITDLPIHTWSPNDEGQQCIAIIKGLPLVFRGKTPMQAHGAADKWRKSEVAKQDKKKAEAARAEKRRQRKVAAE